MCFGSSRVIISSDAATLHTGGKAAVAANVGDRHLRLERAWFAWLSKTDQLLNFLQHFLIMGFRIRYIAYLGNQFGRIAQVKLDELFDFRTLQCFFAHVDEDRPGKRLVSAVFDRLLGRMQAAQKALWPISSTGPWPRSALRWAI